MRNASAVLKNLARQPKRTFSAVSPLFGHGPMTELSRYAISSGHRSLGRWTPFSLGSLPGRWARLRVSSSRTADQSTVLERLQIWPKLSRRPIRRADDSGGTRRKAGDVTTFPTRLPGREARFVTAKNSAMPSIRHLWLQIRR
jgi:hypothetical protein